MMVANWICSYVLNDMLAIHHNGISTMRMNPARPSRVNVRAERVTPSLLLAEQVAADQHDADDQEGNQEDGDGHPPSPAELVEGDLVGVRGEDLRGRARATPRHHVDDVEV